MKKVYTVELGDSKNPIYPQICAVCRIPGNAPLVALPLDPEDARSDYMFYPHLKKNTSENQPFLGILAHHKCIRKVQAALLKRFFLLLLIGGAIAAIGMLSGFGLTISLTVAVVLVTPLVYFEFTTPLPVEYFFHDEENLLSTTDKQYAQTFAQLNHASVHERDYSADFARSYKHLKLRRK